MQIAYELLPKSEKKTPPPAGTELGFGQLRTNHMFVLNYSDGKWHSGRIVPYGPFSLMPGAVCLHYGQTIFEGIKAFKHDDGEIYVFRSDMNADRMNRSAETMCMPTVPVEMQQEGLFRLIDVEREWCPTQPQSSLYIRPFMFGTQDALGVKPSKEYTFCTMLSPSGPYYSSGVSKPIRLLISTNYHRAVSGGTGAAKCGGNYGASMKPADYAKDNGAEQVLFLNADNTTIEEAGAMNHYHVMADGTFVIPKFTDSILASVTSMSVLELAKAGVIKARQETIRLEDFIKGITSGQIIEAGGFGTAAVVSPVGEYLMEDGTLYKVGDGNVGKHSLALYEYYSAIQTGQQKAPEGWMFKVPHYEK